MSEEMINEKMIVEMLEDALEMDTDQFQQLLKEAALQLSNGGCSCGPWGGCSW